jgi:hypothetical protein
VLTEHGGGPIPHVWKVAIVCLRTTSILVLGTTGSRVILSLTAARIGVCSNVS